MPRGRKKTTNWNQRRINPVISIRISRELDAHFAVVRYESGDVNRSIAISRILTYLLKPQSIETTKAIIQAG